MEARLIIRRGRKDQLVADLQGYLFTTDGGLEQIGELWDRHEPFDFNDDQLKERAERYRRRFQEFVDTAKAVAGS